MKKEKGQHKASPKNTDLNNTYLNVNLEELAENALKEIKPASSRRVLRYVLSNPHSTTGEIAHRCLVGNVSDAVIKMKPALRKHGLTMNCYLPKPMIKNRYNERSNVHVWVVSKIDQEASHA